MTRLMAAGDSMITRRLSHNPDPRFKALVELLRSADAAFTNFEMGTPRDPIVPNVNHPSAFQYAKPIVLEELKWCGFNLIGAGNNHVADYGPRGLMDLLEEIEKRDLVTAGAGASLGEARAPGYLETPGGRVALLAVTSTNVEHSMAVARRPDMDGRPGVNPLRFALEYHLEPRLFDALVEVDEALGTAAAFRHRAQFAALMGHANLDAHTFLGASFFKGSPSRVLSKPHAGDLAALVKAIGAARRQADVVAVSIHAHEGPAGDMNQEIPADFIVSASRAAVDAGADVVMGTGPHMLRGIEIYRGKPIFLSLGSFVFQIETLQRQPAPAYEKHGLPSDALPVDVTDEVGAIRSGEPRGFWDNRFWTSVVAETRFDGSELVEINLHPIDLLMERERWVRGAPVLACEETGRWVLEGLARLSPGVEISIEQAGDRVVGRVRL
jgi:poly-gamma-glutamate capsule biosynthesis protein CapA/YwtB (metallophosphatase superfamily)